MAPSLSVGRRAVRLVAGVIVAKALDFALYLVLARQLGVSEFGLFTFALSFTLLFHVLADLGVTTVLTREVARAPERARTWIADALVLKIPLAALTIAATLGITMATRGSRATLILTAICTAGLLLNSIAFNFESLLKAAGRSGSAAMVLLSQSLVGLVVGVALVGFRIGAIAAAVAYLVAAIVHAIAAIGSSRDLWSRREGGESGPRGPRLVALAQEALPLALSGVFIAIYFRIDAVMLHALKGERAVGLYGGIYRFLEAFAPLSAAYQSILLPVLARTADGPVDVLRRLCLRSLHLLLIAGVGTAVVVTFCSASIIQVTLGSAYLPAAAGFSILIWALPPALMSNTLLNLLIARRKQASGTWIVGSTAAFNIVLNLFLIPRLSIVGASVATVASEVLCFGALFVVGRHMLSGIGFARGAWRPLVAGAALASVLALVVPRFPVGMTALLVAAALSAPLYGALLFLMRAVTFEDFQLFGSILPGRPNSTLMAVVTPTSREGLIQRLRRKSVRNLARIAFGLARRRAFSAIYSLWLRARGAHVGRRCTFFGPIEILGDPARIRIGDRCIFHREVCFWTHDYGEGRGSIEIGSGAGLGRRVTINSYERVTIGEGAGLGDGCYVQDNDHGTEPGIPFLAQASHGDPIDIGADVWLGARCIVLKGVSIGAHSVVGAGSVVVKSLPGDVVAVGVPCRVIKHRGHDDREFTARAA